jgi:hypothetical protein
VAVIPVPLLLAVLDFFQGLGTGKVIFQGVTFRKEAFDEAEKESKNGRHGRTPEE